MIHNNIIIGAGITGLYYSYKLNKNNEDYIILDKNEYIGGRALQVEFNKSQIQLGAGILKNENNNLLKLLDELNIKYGKSKSNFNYLFNNNNEEWFNNILHMLKKKSDISEDKTFLELLYDNLSFDEIDLFIKHLEYTDFLMASHKLTFKYYPYNDILSIPYELIYLYNGWKEVINKLNINNNKIKLNTKVNEVEFNNNHYIIKTNNKVYKAKKIIFCADINIKKINFINCELPDIINNISSTSFIRVYTYHDKYDIEKPSLVDGIIKQIIPINKNILMSAYCDSCNADNLYRILKNNKKKEDKIKAFSLLLNKTIPNKFSVIKDIIYKYWKIGIHYYKPNYKYNKTFYNNTSNNFVICGEMISHNHGWIEGCIESVNDYFNDTFY